MDEHTALLIRHGRVDERYRALGEILARQKALVTFILDEGRQLVLPLDTPPAAFDAVQSFISALGKYHLREIEKLDADIDEVAAEFELILAAIAAGDSCDE